MNFYTPMLSIFDPILKVFGKILYFFDWLTGNYLLAILLFAIFAKLVLFPLGIKQQKGMLKQAKLRPKEMAIQKKYKGRDDPQSKQQMQREITEMYAQEKYNPLSGCMPLLIQLPFILILYSVIRNPLTYISGFSGEQISAIKDIIVDRGADFFNGTGQAFANLITEKGYVGDELNLVSLLSDKGNFSIFSELIPNLPTNIPDFNVFGVSLGETPSIAWNVLLLIPVLTFVLQFLGMKINRKLTYQPQMNSDQNCSMKIMDYFLPAITTYMTFKFPAVLGVYWMFQNVIGVLQQFLLKKMFPLPVFTEEDYKNAERELRGKPATGGGTVAPSRNVPNGKYRSLHRIDEDDDTPDPELPPMKIDEEDTSAANDSAPKLKEENPDHKNKR